jgi:hypothetical protein
LVSEPQLSHTPMETVHRMLLRVGALPCTLLRQRYGFSFRGAKNALRVHARLRGFAFAAVGARLWDRARANTKRGGRQATFAGSTDARLSNLVSARYAELRDVALQPTATSRASVVADPMAVTFLAPSSDAVCSETTLETLLRSDTFAAPAAGAFVVEVPVAVRVQAQPSATRRAAPSKRFYRRSGASAHVGHSALDAAGPVCIRRQS